MRGSSLSGRRRWPRVLLIGGAVVTLLTGLAAFLVLRTVPDYRTAFLVDTSLAKNDRDLPDTADAVGSAAQNAADEDSLSLRRFGGGCGDQGNTASVVGPGTGRAQKINTSVHALSASGKPTLESGLLAGIDDFSGYYPFRGKKRNRIIVVTSHGIDACTTDQSALKEAVGRRAKDSAVQLDFRFVGYKVPRKERQPLAQLAEATKAPKVKFVSTPAELTATLNKLALPESPEVQHVDVPSPTATSPSGPAAWLRLSPSTLKAGGTGTAKAGGMQPGEPVVLTWTGPSRGSIGTFTAGRSGEVATRFHQPGKPGSYTLQAQGTRSGRKASAALRVLPADVPTPPTTPRLTLNPSTLKAGQPTTATASGFQPGEIVDIYLGPWGHSGSYAHERANSSGVAVGRVGEGWGLAEPGGTYGVTAVGTVSGRQAHAKLRYEKQEPSGPVTAHASPDPATPGGTVTVTGTGFAPHRTVQYRSTLFADATTAADDGSIEFTASIPQDTAAGRYTLHISQIASGTDLDISLAVQPATPSHPPTPPPTEASPSGTPPGTISQTRATVRPRLRLPSIR